ncbi:MAG: hypothetical protein HZA68_12925 [Rhodovulum sp.]|nr:hypothetical protein [Rhodovulum sp.]
MAEMQSARVALVGAIEVAEGQLRDIDHELVDARAAQTGTSLRVIALEMQRARLVRDIGAKRAALTAV